VSGGLPTRLEMSPCVGYAGLLVLIHAAAAVCLLTIITGWLGGTAACLVLALGVAAAWDRALLRSARSPRALEIQASGEARCILASGAAIALEPLAGAGVTRYWVALRMRSATRRAMLVPAGMMTTESARLLRLWARWGKLPGVAPGQRPP